MTKTQGHKQLQFSRPKCNYLTIHDKRNNSVNKLLMSNLENLSYIIFKKKMINILNNKF